MRTIHYTLPEPGDIVTVRVLDTGDRVETTRTGRVLHVFSNTDTERNPVFDYQTAEQDDTVYVARTADIIAWR